MDFGKLVLQNRSYRRFNEKDRVPVQLLEELVDFARHSPASANRQPLKYVLVTGQDMCDDIFPALGWAGYLPEWKGPEAGERPAAYIVVLGDDAISTDTQIDLGIACQTIMLGAASKGLGGCMMGSINREKIHASLALPEALRVLLVLALGRPAEKVVLEPLGEDGNIKYWRDAEGGHHVPKRSLDDLIVARHA
ncbi:nitroreductase family protein [Desulfovibrio mangrovi]|nr:nitroreductase family protein [Desulfovibrio mangrovi]UZP69124.1 nitroreductase family protein [Desulfovibrio mangrovi]